MEPLLFPEVEESENSPSLVVDGRGIMTAGRTAASPRPPSVKLLGSALKAIRHRYPERRVVTVLGTDIVDAIEYEGQSLVEQAVAEGLIVIVPPALPQAVLNVAQQLGAVVVSMDDLTRFRTPHPWVTETGRFVQARAGGVELGVRVDTRAVEGETPAAAPHIAVWSLVVDRASNLEFECDWTSGVSRWSG